MNEGKIFTSPRTIAKELHVLDYPSLGHRVIEQLGKHDSDTVVFIDAASDRRWTGVELRAKILSVARALIKEHDLKVGDLACISCDHSAESCILALAIIVAGGGVACAYPKDPYAELLYLARKVEPRFLFCLKKNVSWAKQLEQDMGYKVTAITMDGQADGFDETCCFQYLLDYDHHHPPTNNEPTLPVPIEDTDKQVAFITMSSGTTGKPKAIAATHKKCLSELTGGFLNWKGVNVLVPSSLDYVSGRLIIMGAIEAGFPAIIINGTEPAPFLEAIERYKVNVVFMGTASFYNIITHPDVDRRDLSSLRIVFPMGAKMIYLEQLRIFLEKHPNIRGVRQGFGTSETSAVAIRMATPQEYLEDCDNCGPLYPDVRVKIVCPNTGKMLGKNQIGILQVKCVSPFPGYYDMERMRALISKQADDNANEPQVSPYFKDSSVVTEDGFYITGDLASFNDNEELYIHGRQKEMMNCRASKKVLPQELEEIIEQHPATAEVCVIGMPNLVELTLHCPRAFVVPKPIYYTDDAEIKVAASSNGDNQEELLEHRGVHKLCTMRPERRRALAEDLMAFVDERVGWEKQLTGGIVILDEIPTMRSTGKMDKGYLRNLGYDRVEIYGDRSGAQ